VAVDELDLGMLLDDPTISRRIGDRLRRPPGNTPRN
jgi:hypothetical protein